MPSGIGGLTVSIRHVLADKLQLHQAPLSRPPKTGFSRFNMNGLTCDLMRLSASTTQSEKSNSV